MDWQLVPLEIRAGIKAALKAYPGVQWWLSRRKRQPSPDGVVTIAGKLSVKELEKAVVLWRGRQPMSTTIDPQKVIVLWDQGFNFPEIAQHLDCTADDVYQAWRTKL